MGANLHTLCVDDLAGRLRQKSFGIVTILPSLLHLQTANCPLYFLIHRNSRQLQRVSVHPWWVWVLFLPGPQKQLLGSSFWDVWGCLGECSSASSFGRGKDGEGCTLSMCDGLKTPWVFLNNSYLLGTTLVKVQHIFSSSSDLYRNNYPKNLFYPQCVNFILTLLPCRVTDTFRVMRSLKITPFYNRNWWNSCITSRKL